MRTPEGAAELWDSVASAVHSLPPKGALAAVRSQRVTITPSGPAAWVAAIWTS